MSTVISSFARHARRVNALAFLVTLVALSEAEEEALEARLETAFGLVDFEGRGGLGVDALVSRVLPGWSR